MEDKIKSNHFNLVINQKRSIILQASISALIIMLESDPNVVGVLKGAGLEAEDIDSFIDNINEQIHENDLCPDPDCTHGEESDLDFET